MRTIEQGDIKNGIVLIDKPKGITSFDVIRILRRALGVKKIGHAGTLDPLASGLMILGIDGGTKKLGDFLKLSKTYEVSVLFGKRTTTGDLEGEVIEEGPTQGLSEEEVRRACGELTGVVKLAVPRHSAVKDKGLPLYKRVRRGEDVRPPEKDMEIGHMMLGACVRKGNAFVCDITMDVGSGTYVRSVAEAIGKRVGVPAVVIQLRRTRIGEYSVRDALLLPEGLVGTFDKRFERDSDRSPERSKE